MTDLKPSNILLNNNLRAAVSDFGIARDVRKLSESETLTSDIVGSRDYIAPEQRENPRAATCASDVYSLGVILYELVSRRLPTYMYQPVAQANEDFEFLDAILRMALSPDPSQRFQTIPELARAFVAGWSRQHSGEQIVSECRAPYSELLHAREWLAKWPDPPGTYELHLRPYHVEDLVVFCRYWLGLPYHRVVHLPIPKLADLSETTPASAAELFEKMGIDNDSVVATLRQAVDETILHNSRLLGIVEEWARPRRSIDRSRGGWSYADEPY